MLKLCVQLVGTLNIFGNIINGQSGGKSDPKLQRKNSITLPTLRRLVLSATKLMPMLIRLLTITLRSRDHGSTEIQQQQNPIIRREMLADTEA